MDRLKRMRKIRNTLEDKDLNQIKNINKLILMNVLKNNTLNTLPLFYGIKLYFKKYDIKNQKFI